MTTILDLAWHSAIWSLLSVGGSSVTLSDMHAYAVVTRHWLTDTQFVAFFALSQIAPGPNGMALVLIGQQAAGFPGAMTGLVAQLAPSCLVAYLGGGWFDHRASVPWVVKLRLALAPVTVGLILASSFVLARAADLSWLKVALTAVSAAVIYHGKLNPLWLIASGAVLGLGSAAAGLEVF